MVYFQPMQQMNYIEVDLGPCTGLTGSPKKIWRVLRIGSGGRPVEERARGIVWASTLPDNGPSGGFFYDCKPVPW